MRANAFDAAFQLATRQVEAGLVPFVVLGIAGAGADTPCLANRWCASVPCASCVSARP